MSIIKSSIKQRHTMAEFLANFTNCHGKIFGKMHADANIVRIHLHLADSHDAYSKQKQTCARAHPIR